MPYPDSPFGEEFHVEWLWQLGDDSETIVNEEGKILKWLCKPPQITSFRVNTLLATKAEVEKCLNTHSYAPINLPDVVVIQHNQPQKLRIYDKEVIIDTICAAAVLRGANIFAAGVIGMNTGTNAGDFVSVYADLEKKCKKGFAQIYKSRKVFVGNGLVRLNRYQLFNEKVTSGIAIQMTETISGCIPGISDLIPRRLALLQNLPSIVCVHVLDPKPGESILDMCASPGNKTTHVAALMQNKGRLVAIDRTPAKVKLLEEKCQLFGAEVETIATDSTKLIQENKFPASSFDRVLLDAPCSALGQRPQLWNGTTRKVLRSYVPLQRKLFENAVQLLKAKGTLVYSTCTITLAENEGIVAWALKNFPLDLVEARPMFGGAGMFGANLTSAQLLSVQRFGPEQEIDSVGFFIAKFRKQ